MPFTSASALRNPAGAWTTPVTSTAGCWVELKAAGRPTVSCTGAGSAARVATAR